MAESPAMTRTLFLCGDVMTGRGIDQILRHQSNPRLFEPFVKSATEYVDLAESVNGRIPRRVPDAYVWGVALEELERRRPNARIINLETSVTTSDDAWPRKEINYRMHPRNVGVLSAARVDCAVLANNHVLDWGERGLLETLDSLAKTGIQTAGAGRTLGQAQAPAVIQLGGQGRVLVFAMGSPDSGVPSSWNAGFDKPGVHWLADYSAQTVEQVASLVENTKREGDIVVASIHWGSNWGYDIPTEHRRFAHRLIEYASVDVVHGHSSHHPRAIEVHLGRLILYGCGDFLNDYEGISGHEQYRDELVVMYFPTIDVIRGELARLDMVPLRIRNFRLTRCDEREREWLRARMDRECRRFGRRVSASADGYVLETIED